jgi:hypothetical protein
MQIEIPIGVPMPASGWRAGRYATNPLVNIRKSRLNGNFHPVFTVGGVAREAARVPSVWLRPADPGSLLGARTLTAREPCMERDD